MNNLIIGDLHLTKFNEFENTQFYLFLEELSSIIKTYNIQNIFFLGDINHNKDYIYSNALNILNNLLYNLKYINIFFILGNHDYSSIKEDSAILFLEKNFNNLTIIKNYKEIYINNKKIALLAHSYNYEEIIKYIDLAKNNKVDFLLAHLPINGIYNTPKKIETISKINLKNFLNIKNIIIAHHHLYQEYKLNNSNFIIIGKPYHSDFRYEYNYINLINNKEYLEMPSILLTDFINIKRIIINKPKILFKLEYSNKHLKNIKKIKEEILNKYKNNIILKEIFINLEYNKKENNLNNINKLNKNELIKIYLNNKFKESNFKNKKQYFNLFLEEANKIINL